MSQFCGKCGKEFDTSDSFCGKCGYKRITQKERRLFDIANFPTIIVFILQMIFPFVYPSLFFQKLNQKLRLENRFIKFNYDFMYVLIAIIIAGIYVRFLWVLTTRSPSESDLLFSFSNALIVLPLSIIFVVSQYLYIAVAIICARNVNKLLPYQERLRFIWVLLLGAFYVQYKINRNGTSKKPRKATLASTDDWKPEKIILYALAGIPLILLTQSGRSIMLHTIAITGNFSQPVDSAGMNFMGKYYLLSSSPVRTTMNEVAQVCKNNPDINLSLGCNVQSGDQFKIYISRVNEKSLSGIETYSIAHEMLHTAYAKLDASERKNIDKDLLALYPVMLASGDKMLINLLKPYDGLEGASLANELHSIAPIYGADLGDKLENYYSSLFKDRKLLSIRYRESEQVLTNAETNVSNWNLRLNHFQDWTNKNMPTIEKQRDNLTYFAQQGNYNAYNSLVPVYNKNVELYNSVYAKYEKDYASYEAAYNQYAALYASLRRNTTLQEATLTTNIKYEKVN